MNSHNETQLDLMIQGNLEAKLLSMTKIDGFAIGASASPGEYYSFVKTLFDQPPDMILPRLKMIANPIAQLTYLLCQYKFFPTRAIPIPWELLHDTTIVEFQPFGCEKRKTIIGVVVWLHLLNLNYLGLFNFLVKPSIHPTTGSIHWEEIPMYPIEQLKTIAYRLLLTDPPKELCEKLIDWLKATEDIYGYLEHEPETLWKKWQTAPLNLPVEEIQKLIKLLLMNHPTPDLFTQSIRKFYT